MQLTNLKKCRCLCQVDQKQVKADVPTTNVQDDSYDIITFISTDDRSASSRRDLERTLEGPWIKHTNQEIHQMPEFC